MAHPELAQAYQHPTALRLLFEHWPSEERDRRIRAVQQLMAKGELPEDSVVVLRQESRLVGAGMFLARAGALALVWTPRVEAGVDQRAGEAALFGFLREQLRARGVKVAQVLLEKGEEQLAPVLERNGFPFVTTLHYLHHDMEMPYQLLRLKEERLRLREYAEVDSDLFARVLARTYVGSLDCPEVTEARTIEEVIEGHRGEDGATTDLWWLACEGEEPVGVVMVNAPGWGHELSYMGVVPEARGRKLGRELMLHVLLEAKSQEAPELTLTVDARNEPARRIYEDLGFEEHDSQRVHLAFP